MDTCYICILQAFLLLLAANSGPVLAHKLFGSRYALPIDFGRLFPDRNPWFGQSKTWRGLGSAILLSMAVAPVLGLNYSLGALFGLLVMTGDLLASFSKRRLGYAPSSRCRLLDVLPESMLPLWLLHSQLGISPFEGLVVIAAFFLFEVLVSPLLYQLHIRKRPY